MGEGVVVCIAEEKCRVVHCMTIEEIIGTIC